MEIKVVFLGDESECKKSHIITKVVEDHGGKYLDDSAEHTFRLRIHIKSGELHQIPSRPAPHHSHELAELRVRKWELEEKRRTEVQRAKKQLADRLRGLEDKIRRNQAIVDNMKENMEHQQQVRAKKLKIQKDLYAVSSGTSSIEMTNELKKLKQQTKKLAQVIVQLRKEIPKRKQESRKYQDRVDLLQSQYKHYSQQPLP